ncbi:MAG: 5'-nucleotidase SurE [Hyphomonas sp. TMED17]|nr:MAG: 5'/3'-nucleotidase SurE [Hyphomonas sp. TMED17]CAI8295765.1 MAG: 5'-nucleotidase SurE [Hyphomonas sp. TMED17]
MRILLTNDDGINAPGLEVLHDIAIDLLESLGVDDPDANIWTVAPDVEQSGRGRAISLTEFVRVRQVSERRWSVAGTPSDCVLLALEDLLPSKPDLILSGVNEGQNIAEDTSFSGTVAAALFGMQHGVASIALSQSKGFRSQGSCPWETPRNWGAKVLAPLVRQKWPDDVILNINFPDRDPDSVSGIQFTRQGCRDEQIIKTEVREDLRGTPYYWIGYRGKLSNPDQGTDLRAIYDGYVSITPLHVDLTHETFLTEMKKLWTD